MSVAAGASPLAFTAPSLPYACPLCSRTFATPPALKAHRGFCYDGKRVTAPPLLESHAPAAKRARASAPFSCAHCKAGFVTMRRRDEHVSAVHLGLKPYACDRCPAAFSTPASLGRHASSTHGGKDPYTCSLCEVQSFSSAEALRRHVGAAHLGLKPHACTECQATFARPRDLRVHTEACAPTADAASALALLATFAVGAAEVV